MTTRGKGMLYLTAFVAAGLVAAWLAVRTVRSFSETEEVVIAIRDLLPYTQVAADGIKVVEMPSISVPPDAIRDPKELAGRYLRDTILAGEIARKARVADTQGDRLLGAQLTMLKDPSLRAFALAFDPASAVGGKIRPGDKVDIIASVKIEAGQGLSVGVGKIVAQAVNVLQVNQIDGGGNGSTLVLALKPEQIEDIAFALTSGYLRFALNPYNSDPTAAQTQGVTGRAWLAKYGFLDQSGQVQR